MAEISRRTLLALGAAAALSACSPSLSGLSNVAVPPDRLTTAQITEAINGVRASNGRKAWRYNSRLERAAQSQADLMAARNTLSHDLGVTLRQRVTTAGYLGAVGENLAGGHTTLASAIEGWLASPGHRSTLLSERFEEFGLAVAKTSAGRQYWALIAGGSFEAWRS
ncbi:hypothetical protein GCM10007989_22650 [Devosia pacifica]|uniref:SCP domain-containing protein n=1 Tax=Devosia pacifica TaxID=1335967 RepID=A0A918VV91_9HYPH|nr:CAP domain-containing protein [Devosia pacifica]GHA26340.1 hypothetical protein GCM10007989_22650 [Devosia pacifica]